MQACLSLRCSTVRLEIHSILIQIMFSITIMLNLNKNEKKKAKKTPTTLKTEGTGAILELGIPFDLNGLN